MTDDNLCGETNDWLPIHGRPMTEFQSITRNVKEYLTSPPLLFVVPAE